MKLIAVISLKAQSKSQTAGECIVSRADSNNDSRIGVQHGDAVIDMVSQLDFISHICLLYAPVRAEADAWNMGYRCFLRFVVQLIHECETVWIILKCYRGAAYRALSMQLVLIEFDKFCTEIFQRGVHFAQLCTAGLCVNTIRVHLMRRLKEFKHLIHVLHLVLASAFNYEFA